MTERFVAVEYDEVYYLTDTKGLKTFDDFKKQYLEVWGADSELTEDEINADVMEEYYEYIYEHCMTCEENVTMLNNYEKEVTALKQFKKQVEEEITNRISRLERNIEQATYAKDTEIAQRFIDNQGVLIRLLDELF